MLWTNRQTYRQTDRQTDKQTEANILPTPPDCVCMLSESDWSSDYLSASHSEQSLSNGDDVTAAVPVAGVILKSQCQFIAFTEVIKLKTYQTKMYYRAYVCRYVRSL